MRHTSSQILRENIMSIYNYKHLVAEMSKGVIDKLKNINSGDGVKASFSHAYDDTIALTITVSDIELSVPGFIPNDAEYIIEIWLKGSVVEDGKPIECGDEYSLCWDEIDGLIQWYVRDTFDTTNEKKRVQEIEGKGDLGTNYGKRELGRHIRPIIVDTLGDDGIENIVRYAMNNADLTAC